MSVFETSPAKKVANLILGLVLASVFVALLSYTGFKIMKRREGPMPLPDFGNVDVVGAAPGGWAQYDVKDLGIQFDAGAAVTPAPTDPKSWSEDKRQRVERYGEYEFTAPNETGSLRGYVYHAEQLGLDQYLFAQDFEEEKSGGVQILSRTFAKKKLFGGMADEVTYHEMDSGKKKTSRSLFILGKRSARILKVSNWASVDKQAAKDYERMFRSLQEEPGDTKTKWEDL